jgi:D-lactate dehydrogenase
VKNFDFTIDDLVGFNLQNKTVGIIGTGKIGAAAIKILHGFRCKLLAHDLVENESLKTDYEVDYVSLKELCCQSDIISLHIPLNPNTQYLINAKSIGWMKQNVMLINTARGKIVKTDDVLAALKSGKIGYLGLDVYENEKGIFFHDWSGKLLQDEMLAQLMTCTNVLITSHHAFLTKEALKNIADTTIYNIRCFADKVKNSNEIN